MTRLLLIHTGGTIGMVASPRGFAPEQSLVEDLAHAILSRDLPDCSLSIHSVEPLIDSANVTPDFWNLLLALIRENVPNYDGFIVTHGTDTLAFSAAALHYGLGAIQRPVVLTGSMRVPAAGNSDAEDNLAAALKAAVRGPKGVRVQFAGRLMLADRVVKVSSMALDAFHEVPRQEPCFPDDEDPKPKGEIALYNKDLRIAVVTLIPGFTAEALDGALAPLDGAVLRCYGSGTLPSDPAFQDVLEARVRQGLAIIAISQCEHGGIRPGEYAASWALREAGVIDGAALTTEAAFARLALLLSEKARKSQSDN